ncbi:hypothetical protein FANTH_3638 [Fusarium anthophilum]|uniref:BTB domain-containing protein n=1 Tax=Fusarium anthophilum TaxID=48485 RepID=A0A8H4ZR19_9HYPO|nr:hypothetical protein FANTH_3638 [Fusarium anthophilum]
MRSISYDIDPGGDIELVLKKPNEQNIVPVEYHFWLRVAACERIRFPNPPLTGKYKALKGLYPDDKNDTEIEVRMRVSSRHLILASRTFEAMLEGPWSEASPSSRPLRQISAEGWDAFALAIVLESIHGRHFKVPQKTNIGLLTRIATIVDYYQCREAVALHYDKWIDSVSESEKLPSMICSASMMSLYVSWVFRDTDRFEVLAQNFLNYGTGLSIIETHDLPVNGILSKIDVQRRSLISRVLESLDSLQETLVKEGGCEEEQDSSCTAIMLGVLMRERHKLSRSLPPLVAPFEGHTLTQVLLRVKNLKKPTLPHSKKNPYEKIHHHDMHHPCTIQGRLAPVWDDIENNMFILLVNFPS